MYMFKNTVKVVSKGSSIGVFVIQCNHDLISTFVMQNCCLNLCVK